MMTARRSHWKFARILITLCTLKLALPAVAQPDVLTVDDYESHPNSDKPELVFSPLATQFTDYWDAAQRQALQQQFIPLPPLGIVSNIYEMGASQGNHGIGSAISTDPLFWKGANYSSGTGRWDIYTVTAPGLSLPQGAENWHNLYQHYITGNTGTAYPPDWPGNAPVSTYFDDWVDLYAPYLSRAFFHSYSGVETSSGLDVTDGFGRYGFPRVGSPQHVDLPPTYPPLTNSVVGSTSALVPASGGDSIGVYAERESLAGRLDLITGEPLLTETDLELPFGSAVFRRIRTYSEKPGFGAQIDTYAQDTNTLESKIRGWHGTGWMSSDMPLFYFDASQAGSITTGTNPDEPAAYCYFVPDAHHSIPFIQQTRVGSEPPDYIAPQWFDAMLLYDKESCEWGDTDPDTNGLQPGWITPPKEVKVYLHNRSVIYTIKMYYEDVDPVQHQRPIFGATGPYPDSGLGDDIHYGVPYYGLVTRIEDKVGNRVEISYVDPEKHKPYWDPDPAARAKGVNEQRIPVLQKGWYKGMIDHIELIPSGQDHPKWSLYYTYRTFFSWRGDVGFFNPGQDRIEDYVDYFDTSSHAPALHSILVYEHETHSDGHFIPIVPAQSRELILPCDSTTYGPAEHVQVGETPPTFIDLLIHRSSTSSDLDTDNDIKDVYGMPAVGTEANPFDHQDVAIGPTGHGAGTIDVLPENWKYQLRYSYADPAHYQNPNLPDSNVPLEWIPEVDYALRSCGPHEIDSDYQTAQKRRTAHLLKAAVHQRLLNAGGVLTELPPKFWLYRYQGTVSASPDQPNRYTGATGSYDIWNSGTGGYPVWRRLSHRYGPETIARIYRNRPEGSSQCDINGFVNGLIGLNEDSKIESNLCGLEPPEPPTIPGIDPVIGGVFDQDDDASPYENSDDNTNPGFAPRVSSTHSLAEEETTNLPLGLLADTIYYRWTQPYMLDPRLVSVDLNDKPLIARPASWELFDGQFDGVAVPSPFFEELRLKYVGGNVSNACEQSLGVTITQAGGQTGFLPDGAGLFSAIGDDGNVKWYRVYRFINAPDSPASWKGGNFPAHELGVDDVSVLGPEVIWDPQGMTANTGGDEPGSVPFAAIATHAIYYYPFNFVTHSWGVDVLDANPVRRPLADPMWWTVIDQYDTIEDALSENSSLAYEDEQSSPYKYNEYDDSVPWGSRRVVGMNSAGLILSDRTWTHDEGTSSTDDPPAMLEAWAFDEYLRPLFRFTRGWGAAVATGIDETVNGLVESYTYADAYDVDMSAATGTDTTIRLAPRTPLAKSIRKGCDGIEMPVTKIEYYGDPEATGPQDEWTAKMPKAEWFFDLNGDSVTKDDQGNGIPSIEHFHGHWDPAGLPDEADTAQPPLRWKVRVGPQYQRSPNAAFVRSIDGEWYNKQGQLVWRVSGSMENPIPDASGHIVSGTEDEVFLDYHQYDDEGRLVLQIEDIGLDAQSEQFSELDMVYPGLPNQGPGSGAYWEDLSEEPHGYLFVGGVPGADLTDDQFNEKYLAIGGDRTSLLGADMYRRAEANALNLVTFRAYNDLGQNKVVHPNGLRDIIHYDVSSEVIRELRAMGASLDSDTGSWQFSGQGLFDSEFDGGALVAAIQAAIEDLGDGEWSGSPEELQSIFDLGRLEVIADITPSYDTAGRLTGLTVADGAISADSLSSTISYDGWGNPLLEISPDRLIKRYKYDNLGRMHKTFVGSRDRHTIWRTSEEVDNDDDLILSEKLFYGTTPNDAFKPTTKWMYRDKSDSQYDINEFYEPSDDRAGAPAFAGSSMAVGESSPGHVEQYGYDWRMRRVSTKHEDFNSEISGTYREERTFYDNIDRVRFTAVYAPEATLSAPDPDVQPGTELPTPSDFLATGAVDNLLSLEETVYNQAGQVVERRRYDPQSNGGYLATYSFTDHADRAIWSSSSSGRVTKNVYDSKGRMIRTSEFAKSDTTETEISRSVQIYGPDDRVEATEYYERIGSGTGDILTDPHRLSISYTWYDTAGRVIATADMGSAEFDTSVAGDYDRTIPERPDASPEITTKLEDYITADGQTSSSKRRLLVGVDIPDTFFDPVTGEPLARVSGSWYDRLGKQNAMLTVHNAHRDPVTGDETVDYTIDRSDFNRYGQKVLEHKYAYTGDGTSFTDENFELLAGTQYTYEAEIYPQGESVPITVSTTQVRTISPLSTDAAVMRVEWEDHDLGEDGNGDPIVGMGRFHANWIDTSERRSTILEYGAPIINPDSVLPSYVLHPTGPVQFPIGSNSNDWGHFGISNRPDLLKAVHLPSPGTGVTGDGLGYSMFFFYYPDGLPAIRVDSRGVGIKYIYDADGNLIRLSSDDTNIPLIDENPSMTDEQRPPNAIEYEYDGLSRLTSVTTGRDFSGGVFHRRSRSDLEYTPLGNLKQETQRRYTEYDDTTSPDPLLEIVGTVVYDWDTRLLYGATPTQPDHVHSNVNRLSSITYPARVGTHNHGGHSPRVVELKYGPDDGISDLIDRVEKLTSTGGPVGAELGHVATYRYDGLSRLEGIDLGEVPGQSPPMFVHTDDRTFDLFGRVTDRHVQGFDIHASVPEYQTIQHSEFGYDLRGQRLFENLTQVDDPVNGSRDNLHSSFFEYDPLGRLVGEHYGTLKANGFAGIDHEASSIYPLSKTYGLDSLNRRVGTSMASGVSIWEDSDKDGEVDSGEEITHSHEIDARGGLTALLNSPAPDSAVGQDQAGGITELHGRKIYHDWLGRPILVLNADDTAVFSAEYDGFGRIAQRRAPWPGSTPSSGMQRIETYFYDGVRRIQEVFDDPKAATPPWPVGTTGGFGIGGATGNHSQRTEAEYIWSAASGQPFDTCHVQVDWWDREAWFIQDHQTGSVRAYTDANGEMVRQYRLDAFGNLTSMDTFPLASPGELFENFRNRIGHQGLFAERVDGDTSSLTLDTNTNVEVWYQSRSRWYVPELGRFMTSDPNATGVPTQQSLAMLGRMPVGPPSGSFDWESHYADGWDTYTAYSGNPVSLQDPNGLFTLGGTLSTIGRGLSITGQMFSAGSAGFNTGQLLVGEISWQQYSISILTDLAIGGTAWGVGKGISWIGRGIQSSRLGREVWDLPPLLRGKRIEEAIGKNLPDNFPVIDRFENGIATSIKSLNLHDETYQTMSSLKSQVRKYVRQVEAFNGRVWANHEVDADDIVGRALELAVPRGGSREQWEVLDGVADYARSRNVNLKIIEIP
ncbi:MAG: endonuclease toxin domain-containing protein [Phycisphaerales bacterium]